MELKALSSEELEMANKEIGAMVEAGLVDKVEDMHVYTKMVVVCTAVFPKESMLVECFFSYWSNFDSSMGTWKDGVYMYDDNIEFTMGNILEQYVHYRDLIHGDVMV